MPYDDIYLESSEKMSSALEVLNNDFRGIRTGRATPGLVEFIKVEYYNSPTPLKQIANISAPEPRMLIIKPFDPSSMQEIEKAIQKSDLGLNPQNDGKIIRLVVPPLSGERRKQLSQVARELGEKAKVSIRNVRRDANKLADAEEKEGTLTEDEKFKLKDDIQKLVEEFEKKIQDLFDKKSKEIMEV
ncbi:MAG: ribosome recycling factor [Planctomycetes bacterium]|nr:ribosome recycling factor [Planctomycetota bacterium]